jgi:DNA polymerase III gamma/tau subunit
MLSHHAQLIEGSQGHIAPVLEILAKKYGLHAQHPDLSVRQFVHEKLGVDDAHGIHELLLKKPAQATWNVVVVYAHTLTEQAQNALLKITEEPPQHSRIILITDSIHPLLPTLRSRFNQYDLNTEFAGVPVSSVVASELDVSATDFLAADIPTRLDMVKKIHTDLDKEKISIADVFMFVNEIEHQVHNRIRDGLQKKEDSQSSKSAQVSEQLEALTKAQMYMHAPGNSVKMLLEYLAVLL